MADAPQAPPLELDDINYQHVDVATLTPHPDNPRKGDVPAIAASIWANGWYGAIVAQRATRHILAGNHRTRALTEHCLPALRGLLTLTGCDTTHLTATIPVIWLDVDDDRARRILLADNATSDHADYDHRLLLDSLRDLAATNTQLDGTGYNIDDVAELLQTTGQLGDEIVDLLDGLNHPDTTPAEPTADPPEKTFHLSFAATEKQRDTILAALDIARVRYDAHDDTQPQLLARICETFTP